ncbi:hypothetical protein [Liquorilactobacillus hordei]|uniref:hypothetical protein n=1 Tax=Liquorilactobacillus hordei TaxID=468911 RepID=UPI0039E9BB16
MEKKVAAKMVTKATTGSTTKKTPTVADELKEVKRQMSILSSKVAEIDTDMHDGKYLYGKVKEYEIRTSFKGL